MKCQDWSGRIIETHDNLKITEVKTDLCYEDLILRDADFSYCSLAGAFLGYCAGCNFHGADLYWAVWTYANLSYCDLSDVSINGAGLYDCIFYRTNLCGCDFSRDNLGGATCVGGCDFRGMIWDSRTNFSDVEYDQYTLFPPDFDPKAAGMRFVYNPKTKEDCRLIIRDAVFPALDRNPIWVLTNSVARNYDFSCMIYHGTDFSCSDLSGSDFSGASMWLAVLYRANLSGCNFSIGKNREPVNFCYADLRNMIWDSKTDFSGAVYNQYTFFPDGFCPEAYGMVLDEKA